VGAGLWLLVFVEPALAHRTDSDVYMPPNFFGWLPPPVGGTQTDPVFGSTIKRISNALGTPDVAAGSGALTFVMTEYSTMSPFNSDNSHLLIVHQSYYALYDGSGRYLRDLPLEVKGDSEPRWSRRDPNELYYIAGNQLKRHNIATRQTAVVRAFSEYTTISGRGESDICFDGDHFVLVGDHHQIFVYEISTDTKGPVLDTQGLGGFDNVYITPDDNVLVGWYASGGGRYHGIELYDRNMSFRRQVAPAIGHMDVTRDVDGWEVALWINAGDVNPPPDCQNGLVKIRLFDGRRTCLITFDWSLAHHVAAPDGNGWVFVSTYSPGDLGPLTRWPAYANELLQIRLDGSEVRRLAHHRSRPFNDYNFTPRMAVSRDGTRIVFSSNYGLQGLFSAPEKYSDAYLLGLRVEEHEAPVWRTCAWYPGQVDANSGGSATLAMDPGAIAFFPFTGTGISWIGYRDPWSGVAHVYVDGVHKATVDTFASSAQAQAVLFSVTDLPPGHHYLVVQATGERNVRAQASWVWVDAFDVLAETGVLRFEQHAAYYWPCNWLTSKLDRHSGGTATLAANAGAQIGFTFTGTAVSWIAYRHEWSGIANVYVDGLFKGEVDTYATPYEAEAVAYTVGNLPPGPHSLVIEVTGRKNPNSAGAWIWVDAFEIPP
jgi:hypothetical protein